VDGLPQLRKHGHHTTTISLVALLPILLVFDARCPNNEVLGLLASAALLGGGHACTEQHTIRGHARSAKLQSPVTGEELPGRVSVTKATADHKHDVGALPDLGIGIQQWLVLILERMVPSGATTGELDHHVEIWVGLGQHQHLLNCVSSSWFEGDVAHASTIARLYDLFSLLWARDSSSHSDRVNGLATFAKLLDHRELKSPQIRIEEQQVAIDAATSRNDLSQLAYLLLEQMRERNATTCQLSNVTSLVASTHLLVMAPRCHATHNNWWNTKQTGHAVVDGQCLVFADLACLWGVELSPRLGDLNLIGRQKLCVGVKSGRLAIWRCMDERHSPSCQVLGRESSNTTLASWPEVNDDGWRGILGHCLCCLCPIKRLDSLHLAKHLQQGPLHFTQIRSIHSGPDCATKI